MPTLGLCMLIELMPVMTGGRADHSAQRFIGNPMPETCTVTITTKRRRTIPPSLLPWLRQAKARELILQKLLAETEFRDDRLIAGGIVGLQIVEQATPLADQHEKTAARTVVLLVRFEVFRQLTDALAYQSDLNFRTAGVGGRPAVLVNEGFLLLSG